MGPSGARTDPRSTGDRETLRRRRIDAVYPAIGLAATAQVAAHSLIDFGLQIPAVAVTYSLLLGVACAQSRSLREAAEP